MIDLQRDGDVHVLRFDNNENRFGLGFLDAFDAALDAVEKSTGQRALVTTGSGKFYSNGLDLEWLGAHQDQVDAYLARIFALYTRLLVLPMPTIAALNGHAFAAGAMLTLAHDFRVMRTDRGWFCLPEVDLGMQIPRGMRALIQARLPKTTAHEAMITGRRYTAGEALDAGIVERIAPEADVLPVAVELAAELAGKDGDTIARIRQGMYGPVLAALRADPF